MNPRLLEYYNQELRYFTELSKEFAQAHPHLAPGLGLSVESGLANPDPTVERLIEAFCFLSARINLKLDAEFPRFTQRLLEVIHPNYVAPTPAMGVIRLTPGALPEAGVVVERGAIFRSRIPQGRQSSCIFTSALDVHLRPIRIDSAELVESPPDAAGAPADLASEIKSALRIRLSVTSGLPFSGLTDFDRLTLHLGGHPDQASRLFEMLHSSALAAIVLDPQSRPGQGRPPRIIEQPLQAVGLERGEGLLPLTWDGFHGYNLVHEYFTCPARFHFLELRGLAPSLAEIQSGQTEIVLFLNRSALPLAGAVSGSSFELFCTPVINLFEKRADRIEIHTGATEFQVLPDKTRPRDYEVHSVRELRGHRADDSGGEIVFRPIYTTDHSDNGNHGRYFSVRRSPSSLTPGQSGYAGSEVFLSLVDQHEAPYPDGLRGLSVKIMATNRDLPSLLIRSGLNELDPPDTSVVSRAAFIVNPTRPRPAYAEDSLAWRLIRHLSFNYANLGGAGDGQGGRALVDYLNLMAPADQPEMLRQIEGLAACSLTPVTRKLPGRGPLIYGRGLRCRLTFDETFFSGASPYLLGLVLSHFLGRHVSINTFTETEIHTTQRGLLARWPALRGQRGVI